MPHLRRSTALIVTAATLITTSLWAQTDPLPPPECLHRIVVAECADPDEASRLRSELDLSGFLSATVLTDQDTSTVLVGAYDLWVDAHFAASELAERGVAEEPRVVSFANTGGEVDLSDPPALKSVFGLGDMEASDFSRTAPYQVEDLTPEQARRIMAESTGNDDVTRAVALVALAREECRVGNLPDAFPLLRMVASGQVLADPRTRMLASLDTARALRTLRRWEEAYPAICEVEAHCTDPELIAESKIERARLVLAMANDNMGLHSDVRRLVARFREEISPDTPTQRAILAQLELLGVMSLQCEGRLGEALVGFDRFIAEHAGDPERRPEVARARDARAFTLMRSQRLSDALAAYEEVVAMGIPPEDSVDGYNVDLSAALSLFQLHDLRGNRAEAERWAQYILDNHPDSGGADFVRRRLAVLAGEAQ